jgi:hypothetical protein
MSHEEEDTCMSHGRIHACERSLKSSIFLTWSHA